MTQHSKKESRIKASGSYKKKSWINDELLLSIGFILVFVGFALLFFKTIDRHVENNQKLACISLELDRALKVRDNLNRQREHSKLCTTEECKEDFEIMMENSKIKIKEIMKLKRCKLNVTLGDKAK